MKIKQFEDKGLAHYSYAILSQCQQEVVLIDPARDPQPYYDFARENNARIAGVIETHPHADFVSSHLQIQKDTGATIYASSLVGADYPHQSFDEGAEIILGKIKLKALHTPGHSPDGISIVLEHEGRDKAVFTGDTLFIGDVGRPDLRESAGNMTAKREELARDMYRSTREKLMQLSDEVIVYPAHGAGTLCGKSLSDANSSTIGAEKKTNPALQEMTEAEFVDYITADQPFVPKYFGYDVMLNKQGAPNLSEKLLAVPLLERNFVPEAGVLLIDTRDQAIFKKGHYPKAVNIQNGAKFETWLGSIVGPEEEFYLVAADQPALTEVIAKTAKIGYESKIKGAFIIDPDRLSTSPIMDVKEFRQNPEAYTIVDIRNAPEVKEQSFFKHAINIPLPELRERVKEIPTHKPVVVHCAGGYRSAAGSSLVQAGLPQVRVLDLSEAVNDFK